jgi:hypothetical protein
MYFYSFFRNKKEGRILVDWKQNQEETNEMLTGLQHSHYVTKPTATISNAEILLRRPN